VLFIKTKTKTYGWLLDNFMTRKSPGLYLVPILYSCASFTQVVLAFWQRDTMSSPSNSGKNALLSRIGTVKKMWSSTPNEVVVFFLSFLVLSSFFLLIFYVISASRDTHRNYNRHTPRLRSMIQPPTFIRFCLPSGFQYKHTAAAVFVVFQCG